MNLPTEVFGRVTVVHAPDELSSDHSEPFLAFCGGLGQRQLVLDLDATETLDSGGLTALLDLHDQLRGTGGDLKISTTNATNRKILELTRLDRRLEVFESVIDAVKSFQ